MPHSKLTDKQLRSIFNYHASHIDQAILEAIAPDLLKDLAAEDSSIKRWPREIIQYIAVYIERKCMNASTPDDILLAGVLLRFIDSKDGILLKPFQFDEKRAAFEITKINIQSIDIEIMKRAQQQIAIDADMLTKREALFAEGNRLKDELDRNLVNSQLEESKKILMTVLKTSRYSYFEMFTANFKFQYARPTAEHLRETITFLYLQYRHYDRWSTQVKEKTKDYRDKQLLSKIGLFAFARTNMLYGCILRFQVEANTIIKSLQANPSDEQIVAKIRFLITVPYLKAFTLDSMQNLLAVLVNYINMLNDESNDQLFKELLKFFIDSFRGLKVIKPTTALPMSAEEADKQKFMIRVFNKVKFVVENIALHANDTTKQKIRFYLAQDLQENPHEYPLAVQELLCEFNLLPGNDSSSKLRPVW